MSMESRLLRLANRTFKIEGLQLRAEAARAVVKYALEVIDSYLETGREPNEDSILGELVDGVKSRRDRGGSIFIDVDEVLIAIEALKIGSFSTNAPLGNESQADKPYIGDVAEDSESKHIDQQGSASPNSTYGSGISPVILEEAKRLNARAIGPDPSFLRVINSFEHIHFVYNSVKKSFIPSANQGSTSSLLMGTAKDKGLMLQERLQIIEQRLRRKETSAEGVTMGLDINVDAGPVTITTLESLLGSPGIKCVLGMLAKLEEDCWYLENSVTSIPLDLSSASVANSILCDHAFVLVQGELIDISELPQGHPLADRAGSGLTTTGLGNSGYVFRVVAMQSPEAEPRSLTLKIFPELDQFGLKLGIDQRKHRQLTHALRSLRKSDLLVVLADVYLDDAVTMNRLKGVITTLSTQQPSVIVFMGNFFSEKFAAVLAQHEDLSRVAPHFDALGDLIVENGASLIGKTEFIFIPGPNDPGSLGILPQQPLIGLFTRKLTQKLQRVQFTSNPARLLYYGQEIVLYRHDILNKLRRNAIFPPVADSSTDLTALLASVLTEQGHLCPVHVHKQPIFWNYDSALRLYPLPNLLVVADAGAEQFQWELPSNKDSNNSNFESIQDVGLCVNPGSFSSDGGGFISYRLHEGRAEFNRCL